MECLKCRKPTKVLDSRIKQVGVWRRRECLKCHHRFTTMETGDLGALEYLTEWRRKALSEIRWTIKMLKELDDG